MEFVWNVTLAFQKQLKEKKPTLNTHGWNRLLNALIKIVTQILL